MTLPRQHPCAPVGGESVALQPHHTLVLYDAGFSSAPPCDTKFRPEDNRAHETI